MSKKHSPARYRSQFARCAELEEREVGRPKSRLPLRTNPIIAGQLEFLVQPTYDFYGVAVATAVTKQTLFSIPSGQSYTPAGGSAFTKTVFHTNLVQAGQLDAPKKMLVKAISAFTFSDMAASDTNSFITRTFLQFDVSGKPYWQSTVAKCPGGAGTFGGGFSTQTLAAGGTVANFYNNGYPTAQNVNPIVEEMPQIPGLQPMEPILGVLIEQQQPFDVILDPTISGVAAFTTLAAAPATQLVGTGVNCIVYLEGMLARAIL